MGARLTPRSAGHPRTDPSLLLSLFLVPRAPRYECGGLLTEQPSKMREAPGAQLGLHDGPSLIPDLREGLPSS